jgi:hypothetical protein
MSHFYLTLPSDSSSKYYPENTTSSFKTKLSDRIDLDGEYEVGLAQFIYPHSWYNFNNSDKRLFLGFNPSDGSAKVEQVFQNGQFPDEETFFHFLNESLKTTKIADCTFIWIPWERKVRLLITNKTGSFYLSSALSSLLGFEEEGPFKVMSGEAEKFKARFTFDLHAGLRMIYVYSDIVSHTLVGDSKVPLLRVCVTEGKYGEMVSATFTDPHYVPLARNDVDTIEILINNELGKLVPFEFGKSVVTLHFRRKNRLL